MSKTFAKLRFSLLGHSNQISNAATKSAKACWDVWWDCVMNSWWLSQDKTNLCGSSSQHCQSYCSTQRKYGVWYVVFKTLISVGIDWGFDWSLTFFPHIRLFCLPLYNVIHIWFVAASQTSLSHFSLSFLFIQLFNLTILVQEGS